ncbi:unnamed protein product [Laminaria digitata]
MLVRVQDRCIPGVNDNRESDAEIVQDPTASITSDDHVTITTFAESDPEAVGDSGIPSPDDYQDTMSDHDAESDAEVVDNEDIGKAGGGMFFMRTADPIEGLQPDHGDAHITVDNSNHSLNADDNETISNSSYGASVGGSSPVEEIRSYETAVGEKEGLACEMPFCSVRETAEDKQKEEHYEDTPGHVHSVTNTGHGGCCPVVPRRPPENVPTLSVVPPAKHSRRRFVLDRKNVERERRAVHRGCRSGVLQQGNVPVVPPTTRSEGRDAVEGDARAAHSERPPLRAVHSGCCLGRLQQGNAPMVLVIPPSTLSERSSGLGDAVEGAVRAAHSERPPLRAVHSGCFSGRLRQRNAPVVLVVPPTTRSKKSFALGDAVQGDVREAQSFRHPLIVNQRMTVPALLVVPPKGLSERRFLQNGVITRNARAVYRNDCPAAEFIGVNVSALPLMPSTRRSEGRSLQGDVVVGRARAVQTDSYTAVVLQPAYMSVLVLPLERRFRRRFARGGVGVTKARTVYSHRSPLRVARQVNVPALLLVPPKGRPERRFAQPNVVERKARAVHKNNCPIMSRPDNVSALSMPKRRSRKRFARGSVNVRRARAIVSRW